MQTISQQIVAIWTEELETAKARASARVAALFGASVSPASAAAPRKPASAPRPRLRMSSSDVEAMHSKVVALFKPGQHLSRRQVMQALKSDDGNRVSHALRALAGSGELRMEGTRAVARYSLPTSKKRAG